MISTHTPLAGRDFCEEIYMYVWNEFLLTRPSRDVTPPEEFWNISILDFYSHAPRGT